MWKPIIESLVASGLSMREIAERAEIPPSTLSELRSGITGNPRWDTGDRLLKLQSEVVRPRKKAA